MGIGIFSRPPIENQPAADWLLGGAIRPLFFCALGSLAKSRAKVIARGAPHFRGRGPAPNLYLHVSPHALAELPKLNHRKAL